MILNTKNSSGSVSSLLGMRYFFFLLVLCSLPIPAFSRPLLEAKMGYFFFTNSCMRKVYNRGGFDGQLSFSYPIFDKLRPYPIYGHIPYDLHFYASVEFLERWGRSRGVHQKTSFWEIPLSVGFKPVLDLGSHVKYYFAVGPRYFFARAHNHSSYVPNVMNANGLGGFINTGFFFILGAHCTIDLFGEYSYGKLHFHSSQKNTKGHTTQIGGLTFGGGLGYCF